MENRRLIVHDTLALARADILTKQEKEERPFLYRGERMDYETVVPTAFRAPDDTVRGQAFTILRRLCGVHARLFENALEFWGIGTDRDQWLALLQHIGWPTPFLDLTDDLEVALFFACTGYDPADGPAVIWFINPSKVDAKFSILDHSAVVNPQLNLRWSRQRGYALRAPGWEDFKSPSLVPDEEVDLKRQSFADCVGFFPSPTELADAQKKWPHYYDADNKLFEQLRKLIEHAATGCGMTPLPSHLSRCPF